ncbi:hypothetical protein PBT90_16745 [Algoriphagus halophytocola]|uniref:hypothetical protein n=1 Tax=Algoriphagus halophytocola TaxID=2991499 RepID=UPI0022DD836F|nr:hypothetical protein [Algoriphagus sp. TR-M9]WBL42386.1 hypothetical protein PBT90_16745 [Algoriphagus sp. TR-M9]
MKNNEPMTTGAEPPAMYLSTEEGSLEKLFAEIINIRGVHHQLDMHEGTVRTYRKRFADGKMTVEKMREVLEKAGYKMKQEERWGK